MFVSPVHAAGKLETVAVESKIFPKLEVFDSVIEAVHQSTVSSRIAAEVIELNFDVNDYVPRGAVILRFRDDEFRARVAQIEASLLADKAQNREAVARQKEADSEFVRVRRLFQKKLISQAALDKATADLSSSNAQVQAIKAQIKSRNSQLDEANVLLSYTQIIAPYSGVVTDRFIELGEMASPGQPLMTGVSLQELRAVTAIPQYLLPAMIDANRAILFLEDGRQVKGGKITIIPTADIQSHSIKVRVTLPNNISQLYPGMYSKLQFDLGEENITVIPQTAIVQRSEVTGVYVQLADGQIVFRQIRLGRTITEQQREVLAGLGQGENVIIDSYAATRALIKARSQ